MLERLTVSDFEPLLNETFTVQLGADHTLDVTLAEATASGTAASLPAPVEKDPTTARLPFSLLFRGPKTPILPQHIYPLTHRTLGTLEIFIVPIGEDSSSILYQAVFT